MSKRCPAPVLHDAPTLLALAGNIDEATFLTLHRFRLRLPLASLPLLLYNNAPDMYEVFLRKFNEKVPLTPEEEAYIKQYLTPKKLRKKQYLLQEGDVCKYICHVEKGAMRAYVTDEKGYEHITAFALEGWTIADLASFIKAEPATLHIDALEDCEVVLLSKAAHDHLLQHMPKYEQYFRMVITDAYIALQQRTTNSISLPLEERYKVFTQMCQSIFQRVPQHMIASFMGLSAETLSRVRSRISKKNT